MQHFNILSCYHTPYCIAFTFVTSLIKILTTDITFLIYSDGVYRVLIVAHEVAYTISEGSLWDP
jgi:hypothetical protein